MVNFFCENFKQSSTLRINKLVNHRHRSHRQKFICKKKLAGPERWLRHIEANAHVLGRNVFFIEAQPSSSPGWLAICCAIDYLCQKLLWTCEWKTEREWNWFEGVKDGNITIIFWHEIWMKPSLEIQRKWSTSVHLKFHIFAWIYSTFFTTIHLVCEVFRIRFR